ncbi:MULTISPECIES: hypothetical protein [unclassified Enterococcus]|uniref:DUF6874 family protein n=1 Tax=unclassified Enterococcus TaxID=2608891 RepID=UPI001556293C|nr:MULTISPECIES: hypothetical protein [unclassified Enterococcus]MBS7576951.1 hypothetical protein [Enterococcus sp. MMGLQ5-2]MBS7584358.1 hypothetical protein [Enterococcus sp. MMGLQ5-1]NPD12213.1 hypothetical protein [Enterococcus sp. MMGLQ5-1]NPD36785.1 hypothetical protein [Enterococcus sp. MMGLQ5-2]
MNREKMNLISEIVERAEKEGLLLFDRIGLIIDLKLAVKHFDLKLNDLLNADSENFTHDIVGIQNNIDRENKIFDSMFLPRFSN